MPSEPFSDVKLEIGHVLFIDIVGYSKLLINEQSEQIQTLTENRARDGAVPSRRSRREAAALADRRWRRARFSHQSGSAGVCARSRLAKRSRIIPNFAFAWEFTAARLTKSPI